MRTMTRVLVGTAVFAAIACVAYALVTRDPFGIVMLGLWSISVWVAAGWLLYHRRRDGAPAPSEDPDAARPGADGADGPGGSAGGAGSPAGDFRLQSGWPIWIAFGAAGVAAGLVWSLWITLVGAVVLGYGLQRAVRD